MVLTFGQSQRILPLSSDIYAEMDALYLLKGLGTPSAARPWTINEAQLILERIDSNSIGKQEQALYDSISAEIKKTLRFLPDKIFSFDTHLDIALEAYTHTNQDDFVLNEDWIYGYEDREPLAKISLEIELSSWLYTFTDFQYNRNRYNGKDQFRDVDDADQGIGAVTEFSDSLSFPWHSWAYSRPFTTNIPLGTGEFDFDWPKRANLTVGGGNWNLSIARDRIQWGRGYSGNFVVDGHRDYDEYIRFSAFTKKFKYEWLNVFYSNPETGNSFKFLMAHRVEFRIIPSLVLAASENIMCRSDGINPRYFNPAFFYHNWYDRDNLNSLAHLELDYVPYKGYRLYTQAVIDQILAPWESNSESGAWGILTGVEHVRPALSGILNFSLEFAYTSPMLYRRDLVDFITIGTAQANDAGMNLFLDYTGYPYGGDAMVLQLDASYRLPGSAFIYTRLFGMIHGKMNYFISHNSGGDNKKKVDIISHTPSGGKDEREYTLGASLGGNYAIPQPLSWLKIRVWTELDLIVKGNKLMLSETGIGENIVYHKNGIAADFQFVMGVGVSF